MINAASALAPTSPGQTAKGASPAGGDMFALSMMSAATAGDAAITDLMAAAPADPVRQAFAAPGTPLPNGVAEGAVDPALTWLPAVNIPVPEPMTMLSGLDGGPAASAPEGAPEAAFARISRPADPTPAAAHDSDPAVARLPVVNIPAVLPGSDGNPGASTPEGNIAQVMTGSGPAYAPPTAPTPDGDAPVPVPAAITPQTMPANPDPAPVANRRQPAIATAPRAFQPATRALRGATSGVALAAGLTEIAATKSAATPTSGTAKPVMAVQAEAGAAAATATVASLPTPAAGPFGQRSAPDAETLAPAPVPLEAPATPAFAPSVARNGSASMGSPEQSQATSPVTPAEALAVPVQPIPTIPATQPAVAVAAPLPLAPTGRTTVDVPADAATPRPAEPARVMSRETPAVDPALQPARAPIGNGAQAVQPPAGAAALPLDDADLPARTPVADPHASVPPSVVTADEAPPASTAGELPVLTTAPAIERPVADGQAVPDVAGQPARDGSVAARPAPSSPPAATPVEADAAPAKPRRDTSAAKHDRQSAKRTEGPLVVTVPPADAGETPVAAIAGDDDDSRDAAAPFMADQPAAPRPDAAAVVTAVPVQPVPIAPPTIADAPSPETRVSIASDASRAPEAQPQPLGTAQPPAAERGTLEPRSAPDDIAASPQDRDQAPARTPTPEAAARVQVAPAALGSTPAATRTGTPVPPAAAPAPASDTPVIAAAAAAPVAGALSTVPQPRRQSFVREVGGTTRQTVALRPQAAAPLQPTAGTTASAAQVFGAAMHAASASDDPLRTAAAEPQVGVVAAPATLAPIAATTDSAAPTLDMRQANWPNAMIDHIEQLRDAANANDTRIRLVPDALGGIDIAVKTVGDAIHVRFTADDATTRAMIEDARPELTAIALERGLRIGQSVVELSPANAGQQQGGQQSQPQSQSQSQSQPQTQSQNASAGGQQQNASQAQTGQQQPRQQQAQPGRQPDRPARAPSPEPDAGTNGRVA